jgi:hypothetical protein
LGDFFENFNILEVEIGRNGPGILGVKNPTKNQVGKIHGEKPRAY